MQTKVAGSRFKAVVVHEEKGNASQVYEENGNGSK